MQPFDELAMLAEVSDACLSLRFGAMRRHVMNCRHFHLYADLLSHPAHSISSCNRRSRQAPFRTSSRLMAWNKEISKIRNPHPTAGRPSALRDKVSPWPTEEAGVDLERRSRVERRQCSRLHLPGWPQRRQRADDLDSLAPARLVGRKALRLSHLALEASGDVWVRLHIWRLELDCQISLQASPARLNYSTSPLPAQSDWVC